MAMRPTPLRKTTLVAGLFYHEGWRYYVGPKVRASGSSHFLTKAEAEEQLTRAVEEMIAELGQSWDVTIERKEW